LKGSNHFSDSSERPSRIEVAKRYGMSKWQVSKAVAFLRNRSFIRRTLRTEEIDGYTVANLVYIEPIIPMIKLSISELSEAHSFGIEQLYNEVEKSETTPDKKPDRFLESLLEAGLIYD